MTPKVEAERKGKGKDHGAKCTSVKDPSMYIINVTLKADFCEFGGFSRNTNQPGKVTAGLHLREG